MVDVHQCTVKHTPSPYLPECPATHANVAGLLLCTMRGGHHPQISNRLRREVVLDGAGGTRRNPAEYEGRYNHWDEGRSCDSAKDTVCDVAEGRDKNRGDAYGEDALAPKVSVPVPADETDVETTQTTLWELQRLLNNLKGSLSSTYKKNTEANTKAYDLNQKTMQRNMQRKIRSSRRL